MVEQTEPIPPRHLVTLLVFGSDVPLDVMEDLSIQLELFLAAIDRESSDGASPEFSWRTTDLTYGGQRVQVGPDLTGPKGSEHHADRVVNQARRGIGYLRRRASVPPGFSEEAVKHLDAIASVLKHPRVDRLVLHLDRQSEPITPRTLANVRWLTTS